MKIANSVAQQLMDGSYVYDVMLRLNTYTDEGQLTHTFAVLNCEDNKHADRLAQELNKCLDATV